MADEGIMALPQGTGMQGEQPPVQQQSVTSADSYDAAQTALGRVNPGEQAALKEALRQNIGNLQLTPQQLDALIQVFEYVSQHPGDYVNLLQKMLEAGVLDEGDMPPEYDPEFIGAMLAVLNEMQQMQADGAQEPMDLSPVVQGLQPMAMASGGLADIGQYLASKGRGGDSILAHITPKEAAMLKSRGGSGTINPNTGLPEFKEGALGGIFDAIGGAIKGVVNVAKDLLSSPVGRILGTVALATVLGPAGVGLSMGVAGGLAGAGTSLLSGGSVKEALVSGAMGYIGGGGTVMGVNPVSAIGNYLPGAAGTGIGAAGGALNTGLATGLIGAGIGKLGGMSTEDALKMGLTSGVSAGAMRGIYGDMTQADYDVRRELSTRAMRGDQAASDVYMRNNPAEMAEFFKNNPGPASPSASASTPATGPIGTAAENLSLPSGNAAPGLKMPSMGSSMSYDPAVGGFKTDYSVYNTPASEFRMPTSPTTRVPGMGDAVGTGFRATPDFTNADLARGVGGTGGGTNYSLRPVPTSTATPPAGFMDKMLTGAENVYDKYLSPDRAGLPADAGLFRKYGPLAAAGTATIAAFGGMDSSPAEIDPITAGERARYEESRLRAKARRERMANYGLEGNRPLIYAANGGMMTSRGVKRFYEGGDAGGEGFGYGEGAGAAQGAGMGGYGSSGEGYGEGYGDFDNISSTTTATTDTQKALNDFNMAMLNQSSRPVVGGYNNAVMVSRESQDSAPYTNAYGYQDAQQARDAYDSFVAEQSMSRESPGGNRAKGGYIGRFSEGGDAGERRRLAQARRAGYGLEGNLLDTAIARARTGETTFLPVGNTNNYVKDSGDATLPSPWDSMTNAEKSAFYAANPTFSAITQFGQKALGILGLKDPVQSVIAQGIPAFGVDPGDPDSGSARAGEGDGGGGARAGGEQGATGGGYMAKGGPAKMTHFPRRDGPINGPGTGTSDDIPAMLSDGEFVFTAKAVRNAGGGSRRKGAARMYKLMKKLEGGAVKGN
jgi:hypothetical protein